jgi:hypothetical protein
MRKSDLAQPRTAALPGVHSGSMVPKDRLGAESVSGEAATPEMKSLVQWRAQRAAWIRAGRGRHLEQ